MPGAFAILGLSLSEVGQLDEAMEMLNKAIERQPNNAGILLDIGNVYWKMGNHEQTLAYFPGRLNASRIIPDFIGAAPESCSSLGDCAKDGKISNGACNTRR